MDPSRLFQSGQSALPPRVAAENRARKSGVPYRHKAASRIGQLRPETFRNRLINFAIPLCNLTAHSFRSSSNSLVPETSAGYGTFSQIRDAVQAMPINETSRASMKERSSLI